MASKGASALTGAGMGAAAGTAIMPGVGTVLGAGIGAVGGWLAGDSGDKNAGTTYSPDQANFQYGPGYGVDANGNVVGQTQADRDAAYNTKLADINARRKAAWDAATANGSTASPEFGKTLEGFRQEFSDLDASQHAENQTPVAQDSVAAQRTRGLVDQQQQLSALGGDAYNRAAPTQAMPGSISQVQSTGQGRLQGADAASRQAQLAALGGLQSQTGALNQFANREQGPSAAQAQLQAGTDMAARQQYGMARSQPGGGGAALRAAAFNAAGISGNAANSAATLRAQEDQAFQAQRLQALGAAQTGAGMSAGYTGQLRQGDQSFAQAQAGQANFDAGAANQFNQGQQQVQFNVGANNLNAAGQARGQNDAMTLGTIQGIQNLNGQIEGVSQDQLNANIAYEQAKQGGANIGVQNKQVNNVQGNAETGMALGALSAGIGAYAQSQQTPGGGAPGTQAQLAGSGAPQSVPNGAPTSDIRAKKDIVPVSMSRQGFPGMPSSEEHARAQQLQALGGMGDFKAPNLRPAQGFEYSYKDPQADGAGRYVGPMAQNLEHLPGVVEQGADGKKAINTPRLTLATASTVSEQQRRLDELQAQLAALRGTNASYATPQQPDYAAYGAR
jgi:hypothetical protein